MSSDPSPNASPSPNRSPSLKQVIYGCMETGASNYRAAATLQGANCTYLYPGCLASAAFNYDPTANQAGLCVPVRRGCMTQGALNF